MTTADSELFQPDGNEAASDRGLSPTLADESGRPADTAGRGPPTMAEDHLRRLPGRSTYRDLAPESPGPSLVQLRRGLPRHTDDRSALAVDAQGHDRCTRTNPYMPSSPACSPTAKPLSSDWAASTAHHPTTRSRCFGTSVETPPVQSRFFRRRDRVVRRGQSAGRAIDWLTDESLDQTLAELAQSPDYLGSRPKRGQMEPGRRTEQDRLFRSPEGHWGIPCDSTPTTHILKPSMPTYRAPSPQRAPLSSGGAAVRAARRVHRTAGKRSLRGARSRSATTV